MFQRAVALLKTFRLPSSPPGWMAWLLAVVIAVGCLARFYRLEEKGLWSDEIATIASGLGNSVDPDAFRLKGQMFDPPFPVSAEWYRNKALDRTSFSMLSSALSGTADVLKANVHPPLFFTLMRGWIIGFGESEVALRFPAALFGLLSVLVMLFVARELAQWQLAWPENHRCLFVLLSGAFLAASAYQIDHAQDARPYTLLLLLALLAVSRVIRILNAFQAEERVSWLQWLALSVLLAAGLYTQYFFLLFAVFVAGVLFLQGRKNPRFLLQLVVSALLTGLLMLPWWPYFREQMLFLKAAGHYTAGLWNPLRLPEKLWRVGCEFFLPYSPVGKLLPLLVAGVAVIGGLFQKPWRKDFKLSPLLAFLLVWLVVIVGGQVTLDVLRQTHTATVRRYLLLASPACALLFAYALVSLSLLKSRWMPWLSATLAVGLLAAMAFDSAHLLFSRHHSSDEFKQAARWINADYRRGDLVLANKSGAMAVGLAYYLEPNIHMQGLDVPVLSAIAEGAPLMQHLTTSLDGRTRVWLALSHHAPSTERRLCQWLSAQGFTQQELRKFPGVNVLLWAR